MVFVFAVMAMVTLIVSCDSSDLMNVQKFGSPASKGAKTVKPLKSATKAGGGTSLNDEEHDLKLIQEAAGITDDAYDRKGGDRFYDGDEDSGNVPNMRKDSRDYCYKPQPVLVPCNACGGQGFIVDMYSGCAYDCAFCDNGMVQSYQ